MIWHHVIPYSALRDCWNTLARHQDESGKARVALHIYMRLLGFEHGPAKRLLQTMAEGRLSFDAQETVESAVAYPKWDIVEGPKNRIDDPGEKFDAFAAGLSGTELLRHEKLKDLFVGLAGFNEATAGLERVDDSVFHAIATKMALMERTLHSDTRLIFFRESMWQEVHGSESPLQWKKKRPVKEGTPMARAGSGG